MEFGKVNKIKSKGVITNEQQKINSIGGKLYGK